MAFLPESTIAFNTVTTGVADFAWNASAPAGCIIPENCGVINGKSYKYAAVAGAVWETGFGVYTRLGGLARTSISITSNNNQAKVNFLVAPTVYLYPSTSVTAEQGQFLTGLFMAFGASVAPLGWTRVTIYDDCAIRIIGSGVFNSHGVSGMSTVFGQTTVGNHTLIVAEMPSHSHSEIAPGGSVVVDNDTPAINVGGIGAAAPTSSVGGDGVHNHTINLNMKYLDYLQASKD